MKRIFRKIRSVIFIKPYTKWRVLKYRIFSTCLDVEGHPRLLQPAQLNGPGKIIFGKKVTIGVPLSPGFYSTYAYIEVRKDSSVVKINDGVFFNNNACVISEGDGIEIGKDCLIGPNFSVFDSDFHDLDPAKRLGGTPKTAKVSIGENVFIGGNVTILKGVTIGRNCIIANGSVVTSSFPDNVIIGGNPGRLIKELN